MNVEQIECLNCGGADWVALASFAVALLGLVIAVVAAVLAERAADSADASLVVAQDALAIAHDEAARSGVEHTEFMRQLQARARFEVTVRAVQADQNGVIVSQAGTMNVVIEVGISNRNGDKAAATTTINVLVPEHTRYLGWSLSRGEEHPTVLPGQTPTPEALTDADGRASTSVFLSRVLDRVTRRTVSVVCFKFEVEVAMEGENSVPVRVRVESGDLPDEQPEVVVDYMVRTRWEPAA